MNNLKRGDDVYLLQDGKICRAVIGTVVRTKHRRVLVKFTYYGDTIQGWMKPYEYSTKDGREFNRLGGWVTHDSWCPWFRAMSKRAFCHGLGDSVNHYLDLATENTKRHLTHV